MHKREHEHMGKDKHKPKLIILGINIRIIIGMNMGIRISTNMQTSKSTTRARTSPSITTTAVPFR